MEVLGRVRDLKKPEADGGKGIKVTFLSWTGARFARRLSSSPTMSYIDTCEIGTVSSPWPSTGPSTCTSRAVSTRGRASCQRLSVLPRLHRNVQNPGRERSPKNVSSKRSVLKY
jgi:hypothetical protein